MIDRLIKIILIFLLVFTPIAFGSMELWALTVMEFGILAMIALYVIGGMFSKRKPLKEQPSSSDVSADPKKPKRRSYLLPIVLLCLFLALILFQMIPLPPGLLNILSPKTYELRQQFAFPFEGQGSGYGPISLFPYVTKVEFFKWAALIGLFIFLLRWKGLKGGLKGVAPFLITIMGVGIAESLYGIFEFFSGHRHILHIDAPRLVNSVTGTFINPNYFAGYLLMVIPLSIGYLFAREAEQEFHYRGWRHRLASLNGKTLLMWFGVLVMILALIFSASRMGIACLLLSFSIITLLFRAPQGGRRFSRTLLFILALAVIWAAWLGLDAVISRFMAVPEGFKGRWRIWEDTFKILKDFPLFGSGLGTFAHVFPIYQTIPVEGVFTHAENDFLQLAADAGVIGAGIIFASFIYFLAIAISRIYLAPYSPQKYIAMSGLIGILALTFHSLVERNIQVAPNALLYSFMLSLILIISTKLLQKPIQNYVII